MGRIKESVEERMGWREAKENTENIEDILHYAWNNGVQVPSEMLHFIKVMIQSAQQGKYEANNWLKEEGAINSSHREMIASAFRHVAHASCNNETDPDSGLDPLLHAACRCLMLYVRKQRGLE